MSDPTNPFAPLDNPGWLDAKTYTETEVQALIAAALQRAADRLFGIVVERQSQKKRAGNDYIAASAREVAKLIPTDHAAALEAVKAQAHNDALEWAAQIADGKARVVTHNDEVLGQMTGKSLVNPEVIAAAIRAGKVQP